MGFWRGKKTVEELGTLGIAKTLAELGVIGEKSDEFHAEKHENPFIKPSNEPERLPEFE